MAGRFGIVVFDLNGGDAAYSFVDEDRWKQIIEVHGAVDCKSPRWQDRLNEEVGWLTADGHEEVEPPKGAPERRGKLIKTVYTQTFVVEGVGVEGELLGILTLP